MANLLAQVQELLLQVSGRDIPFHFLALLGASAVLFSVAGEPSDAHAGWALAGFTLWLLWVGRLMFAQIAPGAGAPAAMAAAAAGCSAAEKLKRLIYGRRDAAAAPP